MSMFPGAGAQVYRNEAGEPIGWDYPSGGAGWAEWAEESEDVWDDEDDES